MSERRQCGWCKTVNHGGGPNCINCGGPLPMPPRPDPGPPPPSAPRTLPSQFVRKRVYTSNFGVLWGVIFGGVGGLIGIVFLALTIVLLPMFFGALFGGLFFAVGLIVAVVSIRSAKAALAPLQRGDSAVGTVVSVDRNRSFTEDGRHPWLIDYTFTANDQTLGGTISSADPRMAGVEVGHSLHVVYLPEDPGQSAVWPPM
ncbi:MAG: hypothetical protein ACI8RZ_002136 [Myxococcota bacterium]|jgi:hypothetical protein